MLEDLITGADEVFKIPSPCVDIIFKIFSRLISELVNDNIFELLPRLNSGLVKDDIFKLLPRLSSQLLSTAKDVDNDDVGWDNGGNFLPGFIIIIIIII